MNVVILNSVNDPLISRDFLPFICSLGEAARRIIANISLCGYQLSVKITFVLTHSSRRYLAALGCQHNFQHSCSLTLVGVIWPHSVTDKKCQFMWLPVEC